MPRWVTVAKVSDCPPGGCLEAAAEDRLVALFHVDGAWHALDGVCPHQGGPLGKGRLADGVVTCPWHGWQFDVATGCHRLRPSLVQPRFAVRVVGDEVQVDLETGV
jgi:nitrite reductase/ring-hydroxylating ferredoxin subunit